MDWLDQLFIGWAFTVQLFLIVHFALRKWAFDRYLFRFGWLVYALALPGFALSILLAVNGKRWYLWLGGVLFLLFSIFGYMVDYVRKISWRNPIRPRIFAPYVTLYLATIMFYWWPLGTLSRPAWILYTILFVISTILNVTSHKPAS